MPVLLVEDLIDDVAITLQDRQNVRWARADLLTYLNDAQRQIVLHRPDANSVTDSFLCVASSKQSIPADGLRLLAVKRNVGGRSITPVDWQVMDIQQPDWHQAADAGDGVEHYLYDPLDPKTFYVYPVPEADHPIEIVYSIAPDLIETEEATVIGLDDIYANVIKDYMLHRAYAKDATFGDIQKSTLYLQAFNSALGIKTQVDSALAQRSAGSA